MRNTSIALSDHWVKFTADLVASGRYGSTSEVVREGLRLVEAREAKLEQLRAAIQEGIDSGPAVPFDLDAFLEERHAEHAARQCAA
ncbi:MAG: antitoxin [Proteobacteria bacterium ST_bin13]|nr:MAG: antitoxin [Proteobacteria bacterium ST_bin13]